MPAGRSPSSTRLGTASSCCKRLEIDRIKARIDQDRLTLVPLALYFKDGRAKLELGLGKGRTGVDKRHHIATRDAEREAQREVARARRRPTD